MKPPHDTYNVCRAGAGRGRRGRKRNKGVFTYAEKVKLCLDSHHLPRNKYDEFLHIIEKHTQPIHTVQQDQYLQVEIDFGQLNYATLRELREFVDNNERFKLRD